MPSRIQLSRRKGWRMPPNTVKVDRSTKWGNPWRAADLEDVMERCKATRQRLAMEWSVAHFRSHIMTRAGQALAEAARNELRGKDLACWCKLDAPCHADVLLEFANR